MINFKPRPLYPPERAPVRIGLEAVWASVGMEDSEKNILALPRFDPRTRPARSLYRPSYRGSNFEFFLNLRTSYRLDKKIYIFLILKPVPCILIIYNLTNKGTIISNTTITNNMLLHVSTFKMPSSGSSLWLSKITYRFLGVGKIQLLKYKLINFNKMSIVQHNKRLA